MKQIYSSGIVVYTQEKGDVFYLLLLYPEGYWGFAKGKMEPGETEQETALRELQEETGLQVELKEDFKELFSYEFQDQTGQKIHKTVVFFIGKLENSVKNNIILSHEHNDYQWLNFEEAYKALTFDDDRKLLVKTYHFISKI